MKQKPLKLKVKLKAGKKNLEDKELFGRVVRTIICASSGDELPQWKRLKTNEKKGKKQDTHTAVITYRDE